jgi:hypothetical protein
MQTTVALDHDLLETTRRLSNGSTNEELAERSLESFIRMTQRQQLPVLPGHVVWEGDLATIQTLTPPDEWNP